VLILVQKINMPNIQQQVTELQAQVTKLQSDLDSLSGAFYKNNFTSSQSFNKDVVFQTRLKVPHYDSAPTNASVGEILEVGGKLYICTTAGDVLTPAVFTLVGSQV
jgi:hypothetical protein